MVNTPPTLTHDSEPCVRVKLWRVCADLTSQAQSMRLSKAAYGMTLSKVHCLPGSLPGHQLLTLYRSATSVALNNVHMANLS